MQRFLDLLMWTVVAAIIVLIVINGKQVATLITSFGSFWVTETSVLTGSNYKMPS